MSIVIEKMQLRGYTDIKEGPLPVLRNKDEHLNVDYEENIPNDIACGFGKFSGFRVLPYKMQNHYKRSTDLTEVKTIVYENEILKATFLPEYGGRLYSLYNKEKGKELLSVNPVFQPANLANRNAWFSGGIEWNVGHYGHSFLTCEPVFFAICKNTNEEEFLRMYEYERVKSVFYQIDFYLPQNADYIVTYVKIINPYVEDTSIYYWSNTAVSELNNARVFSGTSDVVYIKPNIDKGGKTRNSMAYGQLPELEGIEGDVSYPRNFKRSNEYFFQNKKESEYPWEAVVYNDGYLFYDCSTRPLTYRKMFCWGTHKGGTKWQEFLSHENEERYVEIQAGIFPTQLHSDVLKGKSEIEFMQIFGLKNLNDCDMAYSSYDNAKEYINNEIYTKEWMIKLAKYQSQMKDMSLHPIKDVISKGKGWGALELKRAKKDCFEIDISSMDFVKESIGIEQEYWLKLLKKEQLLDDECNLNIVSGSFMIDQKWLKHLDAAIKNEDNNNALERHILNKAIIYSENNMNVKALDVLMSNLAEESTVIYLRTLGAQLAKNDNLDKAIEYYEKAYEKIAQVDIEYFEEDFIGEFMELLIKMNKASKIWEIYQNRLEAGESITEEMNLCVGQAAAELGYWEVIAQIIEKSNIERIREGNTILVELWFKKQIHDSGTISFEEARRILTPPNHIDFRMV